MANELQEFRFNKGYRFTDVVEKTVNGTATGDVVLTFKRATTGLTHAELSDAIDYVKVKALQAAFPFSSIP